MQLVRSLQEQPVTTVINRAEIMAGVALPPAGARRTRLGDVADVALSGSGDCLPLLPECAQGTTPTSLSRGEPG